MSQLKVSWCLLLALSLHVLPSKAQTRNLDSFLTVGLKNSPLLVDYQNQASRGKLDSLILAATSAFQVSAVGNNAYAPIIHGIGYDAAKTDIATVSAQLTVTKALTGGASRRIGYQLIDLQTQSARNNAKISEQALKKQLTDQYLTTFDCEKQVQFNEEILAFLTKEALLLHQLTQTGTYKQTDYLSFSITQRQQQLTVTALKNQLTFNYLYLCYLCGITDTTLHSLADPRLKEALLPDDTASVFFHQFIVDSLTLQKNKEQVDATYKPTINAFVDAGYLSSLAYKPEKNFGASAGFSFVVPLYDGGKKKLQQQRLTIDEHVQSAYATHFHAQYQQQINLLRNQLKANEALALQLAEQVSYVQTLVEASHHLLESGDLPVFEYLKAMNDLMVVKNQQIQQSVEKYRLINELNYWNRTK